MKRHTLAFLFSIISLPALAQPDLSGIWFPAGAQQSPAETPFNDFGKRWVDYYEETYEISDEPGGWCIQPGLPRSIWGAPFPVEIHHTESYVTMFWEGYFQYRKIYLEGHPRPEPILHSAMGYSVGHWEGDTLVVETTHLREWTNMRRLPSTDTATVTERIRVEERPDRNGEMTRFIVNEMTLTDPRLYTQPVTVTGNLRWSPETPIMEYNCSETIYEMHLEEKGLVPPDFSQ